MKILDAKFKKLNHSHKGFTMFSNGGEVEKGYRPDYVLRKKSEYIILESENTASRKTFVGGLIKAAHFLRNEKKGILIFVIVPKKNTKASSIATHLIPYYKWIRDKTNLREIWVIEARHYFNNELLIALDSVPFQNLALNVLENE